MEDGAYLPIISVMERTTVEITVMSNKKSVVSNNNNNNNVSFLSGLGRRIADVSGETREGSFLFQRLSVLIQRFNAVLLHDCFVDMR